MLGKLSVALLVVASPVLAAEPAPSSAAPASAPEYRIKKVCRTVEVAGSFIPRTSCVNKKIPIKQPAPDSQEAKTESGSSEGASKEQ